MTLDSDKKKTNRISLCVYWLRCNILTSCCAFKYWQLWWDFRLGNIRFIYKLCNMLLCTDVFFFCCCCLGFLRAIATAWMSFRWTVWTFHVNHITYLYIYAIEQKRTYTYVLLYIIVCIYNCDRRLFLSFSRLLNSKYPGRTQIENEREFYTRNICIYMTVYR